MSSLTLVRHAQASFFAAEYDALSALGHRQSEKLGEHWAHQQRIVDEVFTGPRQRQQQTASAVAEAYRRLGRAFPEPIVLPDLDEYDLGGILQHLAPRLARQDAAFADLLANQRRGENQREQARSYQRMFEPLLLHWLAAGQDLDGLESWPAFRCRVRRGLAQMTDRPGQGRRVVAFTSGGFIGAALQIVLEAPDRTALELNWRIYNAALAEFVFSRGRITLDRFNDTSHLAEPELVTYR
jgi:broad specificity phosphatase PhoE